MRAPVIEGSIHVGSTLILLLAELPDPFFQFVPGLASVAPEDSECQKDQHREDKESQCKSGFDTALKRLSVAVDDLEERKFHFETPNR